MARIRRGLIARAALALLLLICATSAWAYEYPTEAAALSDCNVVLGSIANIGGTTGAPYGACTRWGPDASTPAGYVGSYRISEYRNNAPYTHWYLYFAQANPDNEAQCQALHEQTSGEGNEAVIAVAGQAQQCIGGCSFGPVGAGQVITTNGQTVTFSDFEFSGSTCNATPESPVSPSTAPPPVPTEPVCVPAGNGMTFCKKQDGKNCYTASTGRQICWDGNETGVKTDGAIAQKRCGGTSPCPAPSPPAGETLNQGPSQTVTSVQNSTTTTTTTTNYVTQYGTDAGDSNDGEATDGTDGDGDGDTPGTVSGGGTCDEPLIVTGGDPVANAALQQAFKTRCAAEKAVGGAVSGGAANCSTAYTVTGGDPVAAAALKEAWQARCNAEGPAWAKVGDGDIASDAENGDDADKGKVKGVILGMNMLDDSGLFGPQSCPALGVVDLGPFGEIDLDEESWFCNFIILVHGVFLLLGAWVAFRILAGGSD